MPELWQAPDPAGGDVRRTSGAAEAARGPGRGRAPQTPGAQARGPADSPSGGLGSTAAEPALSPSALHGLQRLAGNAAVERLITQRRLGPSVPLDPQARERMGSVLGHDFSGVRVHTDEKAAALAGDLDAQAFTVSKDIVFGRDRYAPGTVAGDALLAHELAHVAQQRDAASHGPQTKSGEASDDLEQEAEAASVHAVASLWRRGTAAVGDVAANALPRLKTGLSLQRCGPGGGGGGASAVAERVEFVASHAMTAWGSDPKASNVWSPGAADHAVAYTKGAKPKLNARFRLGSSVPAGTSRVSVRVKEGGAVRGMKTGVVPGATVDVNGLELSGLTRSGEIRSTSYQFEWEVSTDGSTWSRAATTGPHPFYWVHAMPTASPLRNVAVSKATGYARGAASASAAAGAIRSGLRRVDGLAYDPSDPINPDPLTVFDDGVGICTDYGNLLTLLAKSVGLTANTVMFWGGFESLGKNIWVTVAGSLLSLVNVKSPDPAFNPPPSPLSPSGWAFTYHVISRIEGTLHDAALDRVGIDGEAVHQGKIVRLVELDPAGPPVARRGRPYSQPIPRKPHPVTITVRDYGAQIGSAEFGDVYPVGVPLGAPSPVEVPVAWVLSSGTLPPGLTLDAATGRLTGKPTRRGTFSFFVRVSDTSSHGSLSGTFPVSLTVS